jgi:hypothetical protein
MINKSLTLTSSLWLKLEKYEAPDNYTYVNVNHVVSFHEFDKRSYSNLFGQWSVDSSKLQY